MVSKIVDVRQGKKWSILYRPHCGIGSIYDSVLMIALSLVELLVLGI